MNIGRALRQARRAIAFGRHMPLGKLVRRVELDLRRRVRDNLPLTIDGRQSAPRRAAQPPRPLFAPRTGQIRRDGAGLTFRFIGREITMPSGRADWGAPGPGPEHQLWRMNLHYMEYLEAVDDALFADLVDQWIDANPPHRPGAWRGGWNSYALSLRAVIWMQELVRRAGRLPDDVVARMEASLAGQLRFLVQNLETDLGGNHLVKNIKALLWASAYFDGDEAAHWRALGLRLLTAELPRQIAADGMHDERSPSYHCQVLADLLECRHALGHDPLGGALDDALRRMAQAAADLTHPDGLVALFNDAGLTMAYAPTACLEAFARLFDHRPEPRPVFALESVGYYGLRTEDSYFVADCGRIAPDDLPAHGHGDVLSFEWSVRGERIIVDQGVYEYIAGPKRQASRAAASHNTLCLEGADQADFFGAFRCGRRPNVEVRRWEPMVDGFVLEGSHDGFANLPGKPCHVRRFEASPHGVRITDRINGGSCEQARLSFLLHPEVKVIQGENVLLLERGAARIVMASDWEPEVNPAVWWPDMGHEIPTQRIVVALPPGVSVATTSFKIVSQGGESG